MEPNHPHTTMMVTIFCDDCAHQKICANKETMKKAQLAINNKFFGDGFANKERYELIDEMRKAEIRAELICKHFLDEDVIS